MSIPTLAEIKESLPRHVDAKLFDYDSEHHMSQQTVAKKLYGPYVRQLTRGIIKRFMGKTLTIIQGQNWQEKTIGKRVRELQKLKPLRFDDEVDHVWSDWSSEGEQDYIYFDGDDAVTGSGADPIFVFLKGKTSTTKTKSTSTACSSLNGRPRERNATTGRCKLTKDTTKRFRMKDGKRIAESVPKTKHGRKAPAGHAKDYKNKKAVGLDGGLWISKPVPKTGVYRWIKA